MRILDALLENILLGLCCLGVARSLLGMKRGWPRSRRVLLLLVFAAPFAAHWVLGWLLPRFGHARHFFFVLPLYVLFVVEGLRSLPVGRSAIRLTAALLAAALGFQGLASSAPLWLAASLDRDCVRAASELPAEAVWIPRAPRTKWPPEHYALRFKCAAKVFFSEKIDASRLTGVLAVVRPDKDAAPPVVAASLKPGIWEQTSTRFFPRSWSPYEWLSSGPAAPARLRADMYRRRVGR